MEEIPKILPKKITDKYEVIKNTFIGKDKGELHAEREIIYIVSGYMRTGTSMMMKAFEKSGLEVVRSNKRDEMNSKFGDEDYKPNPNGFYEIENMKRVRLDDFMEKQKGKLVKVMFNDVLSLPIKNYKIILMLRNAEEVRQSFEAFFQKKSKLSVVKYDKLMKHIIKFLENRKDVQLMVLNFRDVINNPQKEFQKLKNVGWKIDVDKCVSVVDSKLYRFRLENLTKGI